MANTIRIKRRSSDATAPTTSQAVNGELAINENNDILYYGKGGNSSASSSIIKIGGSGAFLTLDTNQTPTGVKTFSTTTLSITGGSNGNVLTTNGSGTLSWSSISANAFANITDGTNTAVASGGDTFKLRATSPLSVVVANNDVTHGDNALFTVAAGSTSSAGVLQLTDSTSSTSTTTAATPNAVKSAYDLANAALPKSGGTMTGFITLHADPSSALHAASKQYVDTVAQGLHVHATADAATTFDLATLAGVSVSYSSGTQAITWTGGTAANAAGFTDGVTLSANTTESSASRLLVKNEGSGIGAAYNGIYYVYGARELRRASDANSAAEFAGGDFCFVLAGTQYEGTGWVQTEEVVTLDTTPIVWQQFSGAGSITAGNGLTSSGTTINIGTASVNRIVVNADSIDLATVSRGADTSTATPTISFLTSITSDSYGRVTSANVESVRTGSTSQTGILQLTDSTSSTSTSTAATPASVKSAYDLANAALPKAGGTMTGKIVGFTATTSAATIQLPNGVDPTAPSTGDLWAVSGALKYYNGSATKTLAFTDSNITGTAANVSGTVAVSNGGTGATTFTANGIIYGNTTSALQVTAAGTWDATNSVGQLLTVNSSNVPTWTNTIDGGGY